MDQTQLIVLLSSVLKLRLTRPVRPVEETVRSAVKTRFDQNPVKLGQTHGWTENPAIEPVIDPPVHGFKKKIYVLISKF